MRETAQKEKEKLTPATFDIAVNEPELIREKIIQITHTQVEKVNSS